MANGRPTLSCQVKSLSVQLCTGRLFCFCNNPPPSLKLRNRPAFLIDLSGLGARLPLGYLHPRHDHA